MEMKEVTAVVKWKYFTQPLWLSKRDDISQSSKLVWGMLYQFIVMGNKSVHPKIKTIAAYVGKTDRTVHKCIKELSEKGLLSYSRESGIGNKYTIYYPEDHENYRKISSTRRNLPLEENGVKKANHRKISSDTTPIYNNKEIKKERYRPDGPSSSVLSIFDHWKKVMNKRTGAVLDKGRIKIIQDALDNGFTDDALKLAIDGCASSAFHMGMNDKNVKHNGIAFILRDADNIERFYEIAQNEVNEQSCDFPSGSRVFQDIIAKRGGIPLCAQVAHKKAASEFGGNKRELHLNYDGQKIFDKYYEQEKLKQMRLGESYTG